MEKQVIVADSAAPARLKIEIAANLTGVRVVVGRGPSASDPMDQRPLADWFFKDIEEAVGQLENIVRSALHEARSR